MKDNLRKIIEKSAASFAPLPAFEIERPKAKDHGELSTNLAMILARQRKMKPQDIATQMVNFLQTDSEAQSLLEKVSVAGGGFINFVLKPALWQESLHEILEKGESWGSSNVGQGKKVVIEFVSANPTGPLHIGNARGGPLGDAIASLLQKTGYQVTREYYVNDVGGQIEKLGQSLFYWIQNNFKEDAPPPEGYQGEYVRDVARIAFEKIGKQLEKQEETEKIRVLGRFGMDTLMNEIGEDCAKMDIRFDSWVHEKEVLGSGDTEKAIKALKQKGATKQHEGALWFAPPASGEDPLADRESVLVKSDGKLTYFANDIAYHVRKYEKGFDVLINIWGSNHHGHVPRVQAAMKSLGYDPEKIQTVLYQYVRVKRGAEAVKMSKRGGNFVTAREVLDEVGKDALRFFLLMRAPESHLDFDLELAKKQSQENPVYYVQYAHARLAAIERKAKSEADVSFPTKSEVNLGLLNLPEELELIRYANEFPEQVQIAATQREPHRIATYLMELAKIFQSYYSKAKEDPRYKVVTTSIDTTRAKLYLCRALKQTLSQGLNLLGVSAPEEMRNS